MSLFSPHAKILRLTCASSTYSHSHRSLSSRRAPQKGFSRQNRDLRIFIRVRAHFSHSEEEQEEVAKMSLFSPHAKIPHLSYVSSPYSLAQRSFPSTKSTPSSNKKHAANNSISSNSYSIGFTPSSLNSLEKTSVLIHDGCVNTANFDPKGHFLATGSDDHRVKVWRSPVMTEKPRLVWDIHTSHRGNIFHVEMTNDLVVSCGYEGKFFAHRLSPDGSSREETILSHARTSNMFRFAPPSHFNDDGGKMIYAAAYFEADSQGNDHRGGVDLIDLRLPTARATRRFILAKSEEPVKCLDASPFDPVIAIGEGANVVFYDVRRPEIVLKTFEEKTMENLNDSCSKAFGHFVPLSEPYWPNGPGYSEIVWRKLRQDIFSGRKKQQPLTRRRYSSENLNVSSIAFSPHTRDKFLVSWQGDQIACFDENQPEPTQIFCGQLNAVTVLKRVSWFGPKDEYVLAGGDNGCVVAWDSRTGGVIFAKPGDSYNQDEVSTWSSGIINGIAPHPYACGFVSYGLDSTAKVWTPRNLGDDEVTRTIHKEEERFDVVLEKARRSREVEGKVEVSVEDWRFGYLNECRESTVLSRSEPWNFGLFWGRMHSLLRDNDKQSSFLHFSYPSPATNVKEMIANVEEILSRVEEWRQELDEKYYPRVPLFENDFNEDEAAAGRELTENEMDVMTKALKICALMAETCFASLLIVEELCVLIRSGVIELQKPENEEVDEFDVSLLTNETTIKYHLMSDKKFLICDLGETTSSNPIFLSSQVLKKIYSSKFFLDQTYKHSHLIASYIGFSALLSTSSARDFEVRLGGLEEGYLLIHTHGSLDLLRRIDSSDPSARLGYARFMLWQEATTRENIKANEGFVKSLEQALRDQSSTWLYVGVARRFLDFIKSEENDDEEE